MSSTLLMVKDITLNSVPPVKRRRAEFFVATFSRGFIRKITDKPGLQAFAVTCFVYTMIFVKSYAAYNIPKKKCYKIKQYHLSN